MGKEGNGMRKGRKVREGRGGKGIEIHWGRKCMVKWDGTVCCCFQGRIQEQVKGDDGADGNEDGDEW